MGLINWLGDKLFSEPTGSKKVLGITKETLELGRAVAQDTYPHEFIGVLQTTPAREFGIDEEGVLISDIAFIPGTQTDHTSATLQTHYIPTSQDYVGTIHSHPSGVAQPSTADRNVFHSGKVNIILGHPYGPNDWNAFSSSGEQLDIKVYEVSEQSEILQDLQQADLGINNE